MIPQGKHKYVTQTHTAICYGVPDCHNQGNVSFLQRIFVRLLLSAETGNHRQNSRIDGQ